MGSRSETGLHNFCVNEMKKTEITVVKKEAIIAVYLLGERSYRPLG